MKSLEKRIKEKKKENKNFQVQVNEKSLLTNIIDAVFFGAATIGVIILAIVFSKDFHGEGDFSTMVMIGSISAFIIAGMIIGLLDEIELLMYRFQARKGQEDNEDNLKIRVILDIVSEVLGRVTLCGVLIFVVFLIVSAFIGN